MNANTTTTAAAQDVKVIKIEAGKYNGAFGAFQRSFYHTLVAFGIDRGTAHKIGNDFGADLGRAMASGDADVAAAVGKANKNNESQIKLSGKSSRVVNSNAMNLNRACVLMEAVYKEGLCLKRELPASLIGKLWEYIGDCTAWASTVTFTN